MDYRVADFLFTVVLPECREGDVLLPSFRTFRQGGTGGGEKLFSFEALPAEEMPSGGKGPLLDESENDMGLVRLYASDHGYRVEVTPVSGSVVHVMDAPKDFSSAKAYLQWTDRYVGQVLSSLLRIVFSQAVLLHGGVSIHASAVCLEGRAYLFLGKSGTGKSTHSRLWLESFPGSFLLNDDNPVLRVKDGTVVAYGTPWSGKTPCYQNLSCPVGGMARLRQAPVNRFTLRQGVEAFTAVYPGCSVIVRDAVLSDALQETLAQVAGKVTVGMLECLPDKDAALLCGERLAGKK